jgi:WD40 repeat protein
MTGSDPELMTIFAEALERTDPADRAAYLDGACAANAALRRRVEALLAAHDGAGRFLEGEPAGTSEHPSLATREVPRPTVPETRPPSELAIGEHGPDGLSTTSTDNSPADRPGGLVADQVIAGRYTLLEVLGEGGMGTVYRAEQTQPVKRQVALKLIKIGMDSRVVLARFDAERQALALMDHPNIARVYDGGTTATGQPFFVMELVQGVPITEFCDQHRLPVRARLELFVAVCQAVQHAHQKGIIHRDLKPSNVMVTEVDGRPTPKDIDFGVAKATEFSLTEQSLADTGAIVGTPTYMSPEQADPSSMDIDTRTDVYALGVILYELLAGSPPIDAKQFKRGAILEMLRMVREVDPPRPSTRVSTAEALPSIAASRDIDPAQLKRALRGDLDWVVMKALEKDRNRRYETANGFAADVMRHLAYEPVVAAPPSRAYRMRKFVRKNRGVVIAAGVVMLALLGGIAGTTWGMIRADRSRAAELERGKERDEALGKAKDARKVADDRADDLRHRLAVSEFVLARTAYDNRELNLAAERLDKVPKDQRGWEWHYLKRRLRGGLFTLYGHSGRVTSVAFSPDGTQLITGGYDQTARVWDVRTGTPLLELRLGLLAVNSVAFSPDGKRIVTGAGALNNPAEVKVWDARTGKPELELKGHTLAVSSVAFSPDGKRIVTGSQDQTARVWDARTGAPLLELKGLTCAVSSVAFSPDGTRIVTGGGVFNASEPVAEVKVWDAPTGVLLMDLRGHQSYVTSVSFSPDGMRIVTGSWDTTARVWDARTGTLLLELKGHTRDVSSVTFSPDGTRIVSGSTDQTAKVWDAQTGAPQIDLKGLEGHMSSVAFSPDGMRIVTGSSGTTARVWDARAGTLLLELKHASRVSCASFSPDGTRILTGSADKTVRVWDARTGAPVLELTAHTGPVMGVSISTDGTRIVTSGGHFSRPGEVRVWDARTGAPVLELTGHTDVVLSVSFSPDGTRIVTGSFDRTAKVWDARTDGPPLLDLMGHLRRVDSVSFSPDGRRIVTGSEDTTAKVWDAWTGAPLLDLRHSHFVNTVLFSPDGTRILTGSHDRTAKVWDAWTGAPLLDLKGHTGPVESVAFSPDGTRIVTSGRAWPKPVEVKVWDGRPGVPSLKLEGHIGRVMSVAFSSDGTRIVTGSEDGTARVWDAHSGTPLLKLTGLKEAVNSVAFSPDGTRIVTGGGGSYTPGEAMVWDARTGAPLLELRGHTNQVYRVAVSPDGTRIFTYDANGTKVWDAATGLELKGESIPPAPWSGHISPDGRWIAHPAGDHVELLPLLPDQEELADRILYAQPDVRRYQESYEAARRAHDDYAARFYLKLFPAADRPRIQAEAIIRPLFARWILRDDVLSALKAEPSADPGVQSACLKLAEAWSQFPDAGDCNNVAWSLVRDPGQPDAAYRRGLRLAKMACRVEPESFALLNTLGMAQYRCGLMTEALATLTQSIDLNKEQQPADLAFLALAQHRLGQSEQARDTLRRLRGVMKSQWFAGDQESQSFLREAETIELDGAFPADPFAP